MEDGRGEGQGVYFLMDSVAVLPEQKVETSAEMYPYILSLLSKLSVEIAS